MNKKIRLVLKGVLAGFLIVAILLTGKVMIIKPKYKSAADKAVEIIINNKVFSGTSISTSDGKVLLGDGAYTNDNILRLATFHVVGNRENGVTQSILGEHRKNLISEEKKNHKFFPEDSNIKLTVNSKLQKDAYNILTHHKKASKEGCMIVLNYKTGEILCMVSTPSLVDGNNIKDGTFMNKAINAYTPGSVFKCVSVCAVLEKNPDAAKDFNYHCSGRNQNVKCTVAIHGNVDMYSALCKSCNCAVTELTTQNMSMQELGQFVKKCGLLEKQQIADFPCRQEGLFNSKNNPLWIPNGQSDTEITPIAMARFYAAIANNGKAVTTHILTDTKVGETQLFSKKTAEEVRKATEGVIGVSELKGHAAAFAKTGTAQQAKGQASHAWYIVSLMDKNTPYTVLCFLKNGGSSVNAKDVAVDYINKSIL